MQIIANYKMDECELLICYSHELF